MLRTYCVLLSLFWLTSCAQKTETLDDFKTMPMTFPGGQQIRVETMIKEMDIMRGMMFRDSLAADRGMLFLYAGPALHQNYMYQVRIPLDVLWLDLDHRVVEMIPNIPPCPSTSAKACPTYGGHKLSAYMLELPAGTAAKFRVQLGDRIKF
jgi:uncharacterized membrane protein (UPF0127 family)